MFVVGESDRCGLYLVSEAPIARVDRHSRAKRNVYNPPPVDLQQEDLGRPNPPVVLAGDSGRLTRVGARKDR